MTGVVLAANNGEIGGGEVMLLSLAEALRTLGHEVQVVAPRGRARGHRRGGSRRRASRRSTCRPAVATTSPSCGRGARRMPPASSGATVWCRPSRPPGWATVSCTCTRNRWGSTRSPPGSPGAAPWSRWCRRSRWRRACPARGCCGTGSNRWPRTPARTRTVGSGGSASSAGTRSTRGWSPWPPGWPSWTAPTRAVYHLLLAGEGRFAPPEDSGPIRKAMAAGRAPRRAARLDLPRGLLLVHRRRGLPVAVGRAVRARRRRGDVVAHAVRHLGRRGAGRGGRAGPPVGHPQRGCRSLAHAVESVFDAGPDRMVEVLDRAHARWEEHFSPAAGLSRVSALVSDLGL